jgi:hypothetical protein
VKGAATRDFYGTAYGQTGDTFVGFKIGDANIQYDNTLLLIELEAAKAYEIAHPSVPSPTPPPVPPGPSPTPPVVLPVLPPMHPTSKSKTFHVSANVAPATAKMRLVQIAEEIIAALAADPTADVKVSVEIHADFPGGVKDTTKRAVSENAKTLGLNNAEWE